MREGVLVWHEDSVAIRYFDRGDVAFQPLEVGSTIEMFQNGYWHKVKVHSATEEPYLEDCNYGDCLGCEVRF